MAFPNASLLGLDTIHKIGIQKNRILNSECLMENHLHVVFLLVLKIIEKGSCSESRGRGFCYSLHLVIG